MASMNSTSIGMFILDAPSPLNSSSAMSISFKYPSSLKYIQFKETNSLF